MSMYFQKVISRKTQQNPDPLVRGTDPRISIRIHTKMSWIRNTTRDIIPLNTDLGDGLLAAELLHQLEGQLTLRTIRQLYNLHQKNNVNI
jgi:hypothetical protein